MTWTGLLMGMVGFVAGSDPDREAHGEAHGLGSIIRQLREQAELDGQPYGVRLSDDGYRVLRLDDHAWKPVTPFYRWPERLRLRLRLRLELDSHVVLLGGDEGQPHLVMLSSGETSAFLLAFSSDNVNWLNLSSDGIGETVIDGWMMGECAHSRVHAAGDHEKT